MLFAAHKDAIRTSGYHNIFEAISLDGRLAFIDNMGILAMFTQYDITDYMLMEFICKSVPGTKIFPLALEWYNGDGFGFFGYLIVERYLWKLGITSASFLE